MGAGTRRMMVAAGAARIEVHVAGEGPLLVMLPSLGRGAADFAPVSDGLVAAGLRVACPEPRGIGGSTGPVEGTTLHDLAADVAAVIEALSGGPATVAGHAFGNFVARCLAADRPDIIRGVALLAASVGKPPPGERLFEPEIQASIQGVGDPSLPEEERLVHLRRAFFAPGNDPRVWLGGWYAAAKRAQRAATDATPVDDWFLAGRAPVLDVQAALDTVAPQKFSGVLRAAMGDRVTTVVVPDAGHALLPEQPALVVQALAGWIRGLPAAPTRRQAGGQEEA